MAHKFLGILFQGSPRRGTRLDEPGGETITVTVTHNNNLVFKRSATITTQQGNSHRYTLDDGTSIVHSRAQGAIDLAKKILSRE